MHTGRNSNRIFSLSLIHILKLEVPSTVDELKETLIAFRDHAAELEEEFEIEGGVIPMSFIIDVYKRQD